MYNSNSMVQVLLANGEGTTVSASGNGYMVFCGTCREAAYKHPLTSKGFDGKDFKCERELDDFPYSPADGTSDFIGYYDPSGTAVVKELIPETTGFNSATDEAPDDFEDFARENESVENWKDNDPLLESRPHALNYWYTSPTGKTLQGTYAPEHTNRTTEVTLPPVKSRNLFVEGQDGFSSQQVIDYAVTDAYQRKVLNVYTDKQGQERIGGLVVTRTATEIIAECPHRACSYKDENGNWNKRSHRVGTDATREVMEEFVMLLIRHGNNHAAPWFLNRPQFYKVHAPECDLTCSPEEAYCNAKREVSLTLTSETLVPFLMEHQVHCYNRECKCDEVLAHEVPALACA